MVVRVSNLRVRRHGQTLPLVRNNRGEKLSTLLIFLQELRTISSRFCRVNLMSIRNNGLIRFGGFTICTSLNMTPFTRLFRGFLMVSLTSLRREYRRMTFTILVILRGRKSCLFVDVTSRESTNLKQMNYENANMGRSRRIMSFDSNTSYQTKIITNNLLLSYSCKARAYG